MRQLVSLVFERVVAEDEQNPDNEDSDDINLEELKIPTNQAPKGLGSCAADAYLMFQVRMLKYFFKVLNKIELLNVNFSLGFSAISKCRSIA